MNLPFLQLPRNLTALWQKLTKPHPTLDTPQQRQARLLAALLLFLIIICGLSIAAQDYYFPSRSLLEVPEFYVQIFAFASLIVAYVVNRRGRYRLAAAITVAAASISIFVVAIPEEEMADVLWLYYLIAPVLLGSIFFSTRAMVILVSILLAGIFVFPTLFPRSQLESIPLFYVGIVSVLIILMVRHRDRLEADRQRQLVHSEERLRLITDNTLDNIIQLDITGNIQYISPSFQVITGYLPDQFMGRSVLALTRSILHPDDLAVVTRVLTETVESGGVSRIEYRIRHADGHYFWSETIGKPIRDDDTLAGYIFVSRDITERKRATQALEDSEANYRILMEQASDGITILDPQGRCLMVNSKACALSGYTESELLRINVRDLISSEDQAAFALRFQQLNEGKVLVDEYRLRRKDGTYFPAEISAGMLEDGRLQAIIRDITERKQAERQRLELAVERERGSMMRRFIDEAVSHDLRTPLAIMKTSLYLLGRVTDAEKRRRHLAKLEDQVSQLESVFEKLLSTSQWYEPREAIAPKPLDLNLLVREIIMELQMVTSHQHQVEFLPDAHLPPLEADEIILEQAVRQIVKNALAYTPAGGQITVRTYQRQEQMVIEVRDTGIGISPEDLPYIFDPFYRADKARQIVDGEVGLGLTIAKRVVEAHGGEIEVESTPGVGSTFRLCLPLRQPGETASAETAD